MNFLLTNDDGIDAPGLWAASRALAQLGRVLIVAPNTNYSGYGAALPPSRDVFCEA
jgi:5'-nucleotidase